MVGYKWLGTGHDRFQMGDKSQCILGESHMSDPPYNPLTFAPLGTFAPQISPFTSFAETEHSKMGGLFKTVIIEENLSKD